MLMPYFEIRKKEHYTTIVSIQMLASIGIPCVISKETVKRVVSAYVI